MLYFVLIISFIKIFSFKIAFNIVIDKSTNDLYLLVSFVDKLITLNIKLIFNNI